MTLQGKALLYLLLFPDKSMTMRKLLFFLILIFIAFVYCAYRKPSALVAAPGLKTGADQTEKYLPYLKGKRIGVVGNQTSIIGKRHLVDSLKALGISIVKVFGPEHGFRGQASAGVKVKDERDSATGIPVISLYGPKRKPSREDMADIDLMIYDIQDVGCRFYTYINVLAQVMEACAENGKELLILDRPNPNGYVVDGPVLDMKLKSGIGRFPIPITHGMTIGEFARMINGEGWLPNGLHCTIRIIPVAHYKHDMPYTLPVKPSPNLNTQQSIMLYPSTCLFEGTALNHGRGTYYPFTVLGSPDLKGQYSFSYRPVSIPGMSETPLYMNQVCYGLDLRTYDTNQLRKSKKINIQWMKELYKAYPDKEKFFDYTQSKEIGNIDFRTGDSRFRQQVIDDVPEEAIRKSWEPGLSQYKKMRRKYLLYP
jgi:uncharacterized protein YbbC (DUF1343 family)